MIKDNHYNKFFTILDCFASNANYVGNVTYPIKIAFLAIYADKDYLNTVNDNIRNHDNSYLTFSGKKFDKEREREKEREKKRERERKKIVIPHITNKSESKFN